MNRVRFMRLLKYTKIPIICRECDELILIRDYDDHLREHEIYNSDYCVFCHRPVHHWRHLLNCWRICTQQTQSRELHSKRYKSRTFKKHSLL